MTRTELMVVEQALLHPNPLTAAKALEIVRTLRRRADKAEEILRTQTEQQQHYPQFAVVLVGTGSNGGRKLYQVFESWWLEGSETIVWEPCTRILNDPADAVTAHRRARALIKAGRS